MTTAPEGSLRRTMTFRDLMMNGLGFISPAAGVAVFGGGKRCSVADDGQDLDGGSEPDAGHRGQDPGKRVSLEVGRPGGLLAFSPIRHIRHITNSTYIRNVRGN